MLRITEAVKEMLKELPEYIPIGVLADEFQEIRKLLAMHMHERIHQAEPVRNSLRIMADEIWIREGGIEEFVAEVERLVKDEEIQDHFRKCISDEEHPTEVFCSTLGIRKSIPEQIARATYTWLNDNLPV